MIEEKRNRTRKLIEEFIIPKCSSKAFILKKGQVLRIVAYEGKQVADVRFINAKDYREQFSGTLSSAWNSRRGIGGVHRLKNLYSKWPWGNLMLTVIDDKVGDHWFSIQCTKESYEFIGQPDHINCADLFDECLQPYHLSMRDLESDGVFNVFMPYRIADDENGTIYYIAPSCEKGDSIEFLAEMDVLVAATSCPNDSIINDNKPKGLKYQIYEYLG